MDDPQAAFRSEWLHPVLSAKEAAAWEQQLFTGDPDAEEAALRRAGDSLGSAILRDFNEFAPLPRDPRLLLLAGKGHNAGDALVAARTILKTRPRGSLAIIFAFGETTVRPLVQTVLAEVLQDFGTRTHLHYLAESDTQADVSKILAQLARDCGGRFDLCLDGILGMSFRPPVRPPLDALLGAVNRSTNVFLRAAVDLPSGAHAHMDTHVPHFRADLTYATGIAKSALFEQSRPVSFGRIRYLDLGFFDGERPVSLDSQRPHVITDRVLASRIHPRPAFSDKRHYGHLFVIAGSRTMPGAALMNVRAALKTGVGRVTAFVPESIQPAFAAACPEAMWVPCPQTPDGHLARSAWAMIEPRMGRADALLMGSGLGQHSETRKLLRDLIADYGDRLVLDADALHPELLEAFDHDASQCVLTPHLGEFRRLTQAEAAGTNEEILEFVSRCNDNALTCLLKGSVTRITDGENLACLLAGGPVQARGGTGDLLAGIIAALLAMDTNLLGFEAACLGAHWLGRAAQALARARGESAVTTTEVLDYLPVPLREFRR